MLAASEDVEADLAERYPRDGDQLPEFWAGRMTLRRLHVLVSRLPVDSRTKQVMLGDDVATWTPAGAQLHQMAHALATANWQRGGGKGEKPKRPKPPRGDRIRVRLPDDI